MKYFTSYIYYLDVRNYKPIDELCFDDIDYKKSKKKFVFSKGLLPRNYFEYLSSILIKDMVCVTECPYVNDNTLTFLKDIALQREIPFYIDVDSENDETTKEEANKIIDSFGGKAEYLKELERIIKTSTRSLTLRKKLWKDYLKSQNGDVTLKKKNILLINKYNNLFDNKN